MQTNNTFFEHDIRMWYFVFASQIAPGQTERSEIWLVPTKLLQSPKKWYILSKSKKIPLFQKNWLGQIPIIPIRSAGPVLWYRTKKASYSFDCNLLLDFLISEFVRISIQGCIVIRVAKVVEIKDLELDWS